jgi:nitrogen fixation protein FixH
MYADFIAAIQPMVAHKELFAVFCAGYVVGGAALFYAFSTQGSRFTFVSMQVFFTGICALNQGIMVSASRGWLSGLVVFALFAVCLNLTSPIFIRRNIRRARLKVGMANTFTAQALEQFEQLKQPGQEFITTASIEAVLINPAISTHDRMVYSWLRENIAHIGHKVGEFGTYVVTIDGATNKIVDWYGITRADLDGFATNKVKDISGGWVRTPLAPATPV